MRRTLRADTGTNLIELSLAMFLILLVLAGAVDVGRAFHTFIIITNASREGARFASRFPQNSAAIRSAVQQEAWGTIATIATEDISIAPDPDAGPAAQPGEPIRVTVECGSPTFLGGILGVEAITVQSTGEMIVFGQP